MKKKNLILGLLLGLGLAFFIPKQVQAGPPWCANSHGYKVTGLDSNYLQGATTKIDFTVHDVWDGRSYQLMLSPGHARGEVKIGSPITATSPSIYFSTSDPLAITKTKGKNKTLYLEFNSSGNTETCKLATYDIKVEEGKCVVTASQAGFPNPDCLDHKSPITFKISNATWGDSTYSGIILLKINDYTVTKNLDNNGNLTFVLNNPERIGTGKDKKVKINKAWSLAWITMCETTVGKLQEECTDEQRKKVSDGAWEICNQIPESGPIDKCLECFRQDGNGDGKPDGVWTAIGCIDTSSTEGIVGKLMTVGISIAGGIALLMILAAAFLFATSEGEPKRTSEAKEILTSAIIGLIFIIFSVTLLQFIGVNILKIPGFGEQ